MGLTLDNIEPAEPYTIDEVAKLFKVSASSVRRWANEGKLQAIKTPGGAIRVAGTELIRIAGSAVTVAPRETSSERQQRIDAGLKRIRAAKR